MTNIEKDYRAAADWAEHEMDLSQATGGVTHHGAAAAAHGRALLEQAAGGPEQLARLVGRGRRSIDPQAGPGEHAKVRQVRLPAAADRELEAVAAAQNRKPSAVMRDALAEYLAAHPVAS